MIKITNTATNVERTTTTNAGGVYRFAGVDPGNYDVSFQASGFVEVDVHGIQVTTSQEVTLNQSLTLSAAAASMEVAEDLLGVDLAKSSSTIERTLPNSFIENVPTTTALRPVNQLALLAPTAVRGAGSTGVSVNGQRARNDNFLLDGNR